MQNEFEALLAEFEDQDDCDCHNLELANTMVERFPGEVRAWVARVRVHSKHGDADAARSDLARAKAIDAKAAPVIWMEASFAQDEGRIDHATAILDEALAREPFHYGCLLLRGWIASEQEDDARAEACWRKAVEHHPGRKRTINNLVGLYIRTGRYDEIERMHARLLALGPVDGMTEYNIGTQLMEHKQNAMAIAFFDRGRALLGEQNAIQHNRALCLEKLGRHEEAIAEWSQLLAREPDWSWPRLGRIRSLREIGRNEEALADVHYLQKLEPQNVELREKAASILYSLDRYDESIGVLDGLIRDNPSDKWAVNLRGRCYLDKGQADKAKPDFEAALHLDDEHFNARRNLARAELDLRNYEAAQENAEVAIALDPDDWTVRALRAEALAAQGESDLAIKEYEAWIKRFPDETDARRKLGRLLIELKQWSAAQQQYEAIYRLERSGYAAYNVGLCEENKQRKEAAASWYKKAEASYREENQADDAESCVQALKRLSAPRWSLTRLFGG